MKNLRSKRRVDKRAHRRIVVTKNHDGEPSRLTPEIAGAVEKHPRETLFALIQHAAITAQETGDEDALRTAYVLAALHWTAHKGGDQKTLKDLSDVARLALEKGGALQTMGDGVSLYLESSGYSYAVALVGRPAHRSDIAMMLREQVGRRIGAALDRKTIAGELAWNIVCLWPKANWEDRESIARDVRVLRAIHERDPERAVRDALRAAGEEDVKNLFSRRDQKHRRSKKAAE